MHNGCLLLLAFVAVFQPIASYAERVDGRQERCDYRTSLRDPGGYFHGSYRFTKPAVEDRRLNRREDIRDVRRNEVREESLRTASSLDRRLSDTLERHENTVTRSAINRIGNEAVLRRELRETRLTADRDQRNQDIRRERLSRVQKADELHRPSRQTRGLSANEHRYQSRIDTRRFNEPRVSIESRRDTRRNGNHAETQRIIERETRVATGRQGVDVANNPDERRLSRERVQRMAMRRSESRIQLDRNADREILQRRSREFRSSVMLSDRVNRAYDNEESRMASREDTRSLDRDDRRTSSSRRSSDEQRQQRDISRIQRQMLSAERRNIDESATRRNRNLNDRTVENRRNSQLFERARSPESRRDNRNTERNARLTRAVRSVDDRVSQTDRIGSRIFESERSVENRRDVRDAQSMDRIRSLERSAENQRGSRSSERARVSEIRRDIRNIERESQPIINDNGVTETRRDIRNTERDSRALERNVRTAELRNNRDTCVFDRERSVMMRQRMLTVERAAQRQRITRTIECESRNQRLERPVANRRDTNDAESFLTRGRERVFESRRDLRSIDRARSLENQRDVRNDDARGGGFRAERTDESRRNVRNIESRVFRTERAESRREARNVESTAIRMQRADESRRDIRNLKSRVFRSERTGENRRDSRNVESRVFRAARANEDRRDTRYVEARAFQTERTDEIRRDIRIADNRVFRTERADESRRDLRSVESRASRIERATDNRRKVRDFERLSRSLNRVADYRRDSRDNERDARINERTSESRRDIRNAERQSRTEDERVISSRRAIRSLERDSRMKARERSVETNLNRRSVAKDSRTSVFDRLSEERRERVTENHRDFRNTRRESRLLDAPEGRRVGSRAMNLVRSRSDLMERKNERVAERLSKRDLLDSRYTLQRESSSENRRVSERDIVASRIREETRNALTNFARQREFQTMFKNPAQTEEETPAMNWQYMFYTLQGLYICGVLIQFMNERSADKKTRYTWWSAPQHLIKVD